MPHKSVSDQLGDVSAITNDLLNLINSRRTGNTYAPVAGPEVPELNLSANDISQIFDNLHQLGTQIQQIVNESRSKYSHHNITKLSQNLINHHAVALSTIVSIQQGQTSSYNYGMIFPAVAGFRNSILDLKNAVITLDSYSPVRSGASTEFPKTTSKYNWSKIGAVIGVIAIIITAGGYFLYPTSIEQTGGGVNVGNSDQVIVNSGFGDIILNNNTFNVLKNQEIIEAHGLLYRNETLGFEIARPNVKWYFDTDLSNLKLERVGTLPRERFLGGIFIGTNTDENVFVAVFDISKLNKDSLEGYVDSQITWILENYPEPELRTKQISTNGQWALFGIVTGDNKKLYGEQILELRGEKLYMLQASGALPEEMDLEKKEDMRKIIDSFIPI